MLHLTPNRATRAEGGAICDLGGHQNVAGLAVPALGEHPHHHFFNGSTWKKK